MFYRFSVSPAIYAPIPTTGPLKPLGRFFAAAVSLGCLLVLIIAVRLTPSPEGVGTHTALGLDQCGFLARTGIPCAACGMTTSFAWFVRGNLLASFYVQPMGCVLALLCAVTVSAAAYAAFTGAAVHRVILMLPKRYHLIPLLGFGLIAWAWKIFIHTHGIDGWPR